VKKKKKKKQKESGMGVKNRVALITGGGRGIGRAIALKLAAGGAKIVLLDVLDPEKMAKVVEECTAAGAPLAKGYKLDVTNEQDVERVVDQVNTDFGGIDILVNNAGITRDDLLLRMEVSAWDAVINVNLKGTFLMSKVSARYMIRSRRGRIVNISSVSGLVGNPGQANYAASKSGVLGLTKTIARELAGRNVTANAVAPGFIETDMTAALPAEVKEKFMLTIPLKRAGKAEDVAQAVAFFADDDSAYITGQTIAVDGGMVM
jgi:3-oxoacyl-[acyl-carrier protein] reductase